MRDYLVLFLVAIGAIKALRHPWVGVMLWTWISIMNPHRFGYGNAFDAPVAAVAAGVTVIGFLITRDQRSSPFKEPTVAVFAAFVVWMTISWLAGLAPADDYPQWSKVMKIDFMIFIALAVLHSKKHVVALVWVCAGSLALLGAKGGLFTLLTGGGLHVYGPPGTFIEDNNEFAVALIMTIPLLRFLQLQVINAWGKRGLGVAMLLCAVSALGSQSRGALLGLSAMGLLLWWRGANRARNGVLMVVVVVALLAFMPSSWYERMQTMNTYGEDRSAMGRISAWWTAWNLARDYLAGVGFNAVRPELFARYSPYPDLIQAAHSIYFQVLGHHGFIG
ncbi:MAG: putative O-glycosylation ligase, exosortase A system-associated, partial [Rhizobacter sp.]